MPILDILQSVPILGFFPAAIFLFIAVSGETSSGVELAAIFLIFTSQAWNLAFAVYESVSAIPSDLDEASGSLRLGTLATLRKLYLPASIPKLVYNGILSWSAGWYWLVAAEIISLGSKQYRLVGIGRFLAEATYSGNYVGTILGLATLVVTILIVDLLLWRPLREYTERFRYDAVSSEKVVHRTLFHASSFALLISHLRLSPRGKPVQHPPAVSVTRSLPSAWRAWRLAGKPRGYLGKRLKPFVLVSIFAIIVALFVLSFLALVAFIQIIFQDLGKPALSLQLSQLPSSLGASAVRLIIAYGLSLAWTLPLAIKIGSIDKAFGASIFMMEVLASIPATALFPIIILATINLPGGVQLTSILLTMTGMHWYLLFNLIGGVRAIPSDLVEASKTYRLRGLDRWKKLVLPAMLPSLITGSITALGGGWNALVVSEYVTFRGEVTSVHGIGAFLDRAAYEQGSVTLLLIGIFAMVIVVVGTNRLFWRRLYRIVLSRFRVD